MAMEKKLCLRNKYWVLRHGKSIPNEKGLIVSSMVLLPIFLKTLPFIPKPVSVLVQFITSG